MDLNTNQHSASTASRIQEIKMKGYHLDFTETFNEAFEIYKKIALIAGLGVLLVVVGAIIFGFGGLALFIGGDLTIDNFQMFNDPDSSLQFEIIYLGFLSLLTALITPITAGFLQLAYDADKNQDVSFGTIFSFYSHPAFKNLFISGLILSALSAVISIGFKFLDLEMLGILLSIIITFLTFLTVPLIIFGKLSALDAIQASITVVSKNPLMIIGLLIVAYLFALMGLIALCIGYLFTTPFLYAMYYSIYKKSVGIDTDAVELVKSEDYF